MGLSTAVCIVLFGQFVTSIFLLHVYECKRLDGYKFPVYSTSSCPGNESEWNKRSAALKCNRTNGYTCLPNEKFTEILEFCYTAPWIWIQEGVCLYLQKKGSYVDSYSCSHFKDGCHNSSYQSRRIFEYPACISIGNGCFLAEHSCESSTDNTHRPETTETTEKSKEDWLLAMIVTEILVSFLFSCMLCIFISKKRVCKRSTDTEGMTGLEESKSLIANPENETNDPSNECNESRSEKAVFDQWEEDDSYFVSTKACEEVENRIKSKNLVVVVGHSGSGKSAIIQHIALKYKKQGWTVRRVEQVEDIVDEYNSSRFQKDKTICVFNDPFGKESFNEMLNNSWQTKSEELKSYLKTAKLMMSCRSHINLDARLTRYLVNQSFIVDINDNKNKLSVNEKRKILTKYTCDMNLRGKDCDMIVKVEKYFPLLCKLYSSKEEYQKKGILFFTKPVTFLEKEILDFRIKDTHKYCALALLVLFDDNLCVSELLKHKNTENKFKHTLNLCGLSQNTPPSAIGDSLKSLEGFFVKRIGDTYHFYHDFVMEVITYVFGNDNPIETVNYADIGFLRRRIRLEKTEKHSEPFMIYLSDRYIKELGERLYTELFGDRLLDVVLNPCLRNEKVIEVLQKKIESSENLHMLLEAKTLAIDKQELNDHTYKNLVLSKLSLFSLENEVSPLFALIAFCHTQLVQCCVNTLQQNKIDFVNCFLVFALYINGSLQLFNNFFEEHVKESLNKTWRGLYPIHIVSMFHNYELLKELIKRGANVNTKNDLKGVLTPLMLAAGNDTKEYGDFYQYDRKSCATQRDETVQLLLRNGADINLCMDHGDSPLLLACCYGYNSTVQLLLSNGADINLREGNGADSLIEACFGGHDSTIQNLLSYGACVNSQMDDGASPLFIACKNGHDSTVQLLISNKADINLCNIYGLTPLCIACEKGHDSTVQLLLNNGADINICSNDGVSPLYIACHYGNNSTVQLLQSNGADIDSCMENGASPLSTACQYGHNSTVQLLLKNGACINLCIKDRVSPLFVAFECRRYETVNILLNHGVDTSLACRWEDKQDGTMVFLLQKKNISNNMYDLDSYFSLFVSCQVERVTRILFEEGVQMGIEPCNDYIL
ncbi:uncharacterized protein LOC128185077 [Crassostrea angulata]|uniref:uncharacterized protein LOC128185077 n=1 Tax=Magallana angulata TaxID=2784310 RepID=UPI0022B1CF66|nr:uncharacterized protein LOC128185077 [Crassostrea angulata]